MIKHAAIKFNNIVYVGKRHNHCIAIMVECGLPIPIRGIQGFVDNKGNFLDRKQALEIAQRCGQIKKKHHPKDELMSEDIY